MFLSRVRLLAKTASQVTKTREQTSSVARAGTHAGVISMWNAAQRCGSIVETETGNVFQIANARAFETVLPTTLRSLAGAKVRFNVSDSSDADRVIIRNHAEPITARSYLRASPVDFLAPFRSQGDDNEKTPADAAKETAVATTASFARDVVVDLASLSSTQLVRAHAPAVSHFVIPPSKDAKDMRSSRIFNGDTNELLRLRRALGSEEKAQAAFLAQREQASAAVRREVITAEATGIILAWSAIHRSGVILEGVMQVPADAAAAMNAPPSDKICIVRNVHCFHSALPTSNSLLHRAVRFAKVAYSSMPNKFFAETIVVEGELTFDQRVATPEEVQQEKQRMKLTERRRQGRGVFFEDEAEDKTGADASPAAAANASSSSSVPQTPIYGVVARWSGGQGVVESSDGRRYFIASSAAFMQLVDRDSHAIRGAVVTFRVDPQQPRHAYEIDILSTATTSVAAMKPMLEIVRRPPAASAGDARSDAAAHHPPREQAAAATVVEVNAVTGEKVPRSVDVEPEGVEWCYGMLLSWSPQEDQGIIHGSDGTRYVLRDAAEHVIRYASCKPQLKNGRRVKFTAFGTTGRLACNVVVLDTEAAEEELREEELRPSEPQFSMDGNVREAIASPTSTAYWLKRMDRAGYDTREVKQLQNRALTLDEDADDTEDGKFLDSEELFKKDHWWSDRRKNVRFPNSDMTAGHLALIGPASMMNTAMRAKDPKKLERMTKKYQERLTEDQKEYAWKQAKEMAPKYEALIKKAKANDEEPTFYFY